MKIKFVILISLFSTSLLIGADLGKELYTKKCASCHGKDADKKAMGTSEKINTLTLEEIKNSLIGYQDGSYSGKYKSMKRSLARKLGQEDISAVAAYIQTLGQ